MTLDLCCPVAAYGHATVPFAGFDEWRKTNCQKRQSAAFAQTCKLGDEQTMVAAEAMFRAIDSAGWSGRSFEDWGIVAAPQFLGRLRMWSAIERYRALEVRGASPRHIPTVSQHAVAGTLSVIFQCRGPCFGAGGSQGSLLDGFVNAASLAAGGIAPGFWLAISQWSPEPLPQASVADNGAARCHAAVLALLPPVATFNHLEPNSDRRSDCHSDLRTGSGSGLDSAVDHSRANSPGSGAAAVAERVAETVAPGAAGVASRLTEADVQAAEFELVVRFRPTLHRHEVDANVSDVQDFLDASTAPGSVWKRSLAAGVWVELRRRRARFAALPRVA
ncbi:MAG: hypothetical protein RLY70_3752 [Planctomycetota bacterium]|jgi:hypothetical protein